MQMVQLFINLIFKYPQSVSAGDTLFKVPISAESIRVLLLNLLESRTEASFVLSDLPFHIPPTSLKPGRGSYSCSAFIFLKMSEIEGIMSSIFPCIPRVPSYSHKIWQHG